MIKNVSVIGLGNMGVGLALSLQRAGFDTKSTTATAGSRSRAASQGVRVVASVAEVVDHAQAIVLALPAPAAVIDVIEARVNWGSMFVRGRSLSTRPLLMCRPPAAQQRLLRLRVPDLSMLP
jgi:3-hydroxyisobutyrate dehydrogenase-like beta-hydroxyacid dehydrogenase